MSSFFDDASLVMIPSGYKDGKVYSVKPTSGAGDLTFTRNSNATRVDANGLVEKVRTNSLLQSNQFDTTWSAINASLTGGQSGYDGTTNAWLLSKSALNGRIDQTISSSGLLNFSVYAKAGTDNFIFIRVDGSSGNHTAYFDLVNGTVGTTALLVASSITAAGNDYYRCSISFNDTITVARIYVADANGDTSGTSGNIYIQDAQLEQGLVATDYIETTTTAMSEFAGVTASSVADVPRLDYSGDCPSLLLEPQRTNLVTQSEYFDAWTGSAVYTANTHISPSGYQDAATLNDNTTAYLDRRKNTAITPNATYTFSLFVKKTTGSLTHYAGIGALLTGASVVVDYGIINTTTGAINRDASSNINSVSYSSESYGDYWRVIMTFTDNQSNTLFTGIIYPAISSNGTSISPTAQGSNVFWGAQLEAGSYPTSIIPTYGTTVTRLADSCSKTGISSLIGQTEGTLFVEADFNGLNASISQIPLFIRAAGSNSSYIFINFYQGKVNCGLRANNNLIFDSLITSVLSSGTYKIGFTYKSGAISIYVNGVQEFTSTNVFSNSSFADMYLNSTVGTEQLGDGLKQVLLFKNPLTNAELATLTTI